MLTGAAGVDDTAAAVLAQHLKRLQELHLEECGLRSAAALPYIATLTGLIYLGLSLGQPPLGRDELLLLAPLPQLEVVVIGDSLTCAACAAKPGGIDKDTNPDEMTTPQLKAWVTDSSLEDEAFFKLCQSSNT
uniref:Uncharacterized protein n=1 Tax=Tetradesmus obliquus TaxID=3088 RepID=A0A383VVN8_TETOB|eukprot:jgi/Sobl393_1/3133/SZX68834.1